MPEPTEWRKYSRGVWQLFWRLLLQLAVVLVLVWMPIDITFRLASWTKYLTLREVALDTAIMVWYLTGISLSCALLVAVIVGGLGLALRAGNRCFFLARVSAAASVLLASVGAFVAADGAKLWVREATGINPVRTLVILIVVFSGGLWLVRRYGVFVCGRAICERVMVARPLLLALLVGSAMVMAIGGLKWIKYDDVRPNTVLPRRAELPTIVLLTVDTLSAEDMSLYGYHLSTTPQLSRIGEKSYVFENAFANSNFTAPTLATLLSGRYPMTHKVWEFWPLPDDQRQTSVGREFQRHGFQVYAVSANDAGNPAAYGIFDHFNSVAEPPLRSLAECNWPTRLVYEVSAMLEFIPRRLDNPRIIHWIKQAFHSRIYPFLVEVSSSPFVQESYLRPAREVFKRGMQLLLLKDSPKFIWLHIVPPHDPYLAQAPFKYRFLESGNFATAREQRRIRNYYSEGQQPEVDQLRLRYDEFIAETDQKIGDFVDELAARGIWGRAIVVISADHGESFSRGFLRHQGPHLHQQLIHIPLIIHLPGQKEGRRITTYVEQVDLFPTLLDLANLPIPPWAEGESLKAMMLEGKVTNRPKFAMALERQSRFEAIRTGTFAVMHQGWKLVRYLDTGKEELYHLGDDPNEARNLVDSEPERAETMRRVIYARFQQLMR